MLDLSAALEALAFSRLDVALLTLCPLSALLGSLVHMAMVGNDFTAMPTTEGSTSEQIRRSIFSFSSMLTTFHERTWYWVFGRIVVGLSSGLLVALYFVGSISGGAVNSAKVIALAMLAGYLAPKLFVAQERAIAHAIEQRLPAIVDEAVRKHTGGNG